MNKFSKSDILTEDMIGHLFPRERQLVPNVDDVYELEIAFLEHQSLSDVELIRNGAYFSRIADTFTRHFQMCTGAPLRLPDYSSSRLKSFFEKNLFRTGYATHGLFPYRGKFHPQMIKGLMNIMGLKPGDTVLDPMMGSGTVLVEAALMGINSIGVDASPFCRFMTQTKLEALTLPLARSQKALTNYQEVFEYFQKKGGLPDPGTKRRWEKSDQFKKVMEKSGGYGNQSEKERRETFHFLLLAFLDSAGYSERSYKKPLVEQFKAVLERYLFVAEKIQNVMHGYETDIAEYQVLEGDARSLSFEDACLEGIIFSPPYSFAIDYLKNDSFHLNFFQVETDQLKKKMVGLRGRGLTQKYELYKEDMTRILSECWRLLRPGCFCTVIVGTNNNQLGKALNIPPDQVQGLHEIIIEIGAGCGLKTVKKMSRPIIGMSNTMRREYIVFMQKESS